MALHYRTGPNPGPWSVVKGGLAGEALFIMSDDGGVALVEGAWTNDHEANARLIAAAPSMRSALEAIAETVVDDDTDYKQLCALLVATARVSLA